MPERLHTCHEKCPCQTGGEPITDFVETGPMHDPSRFVGLLKGYEPAPFEWPEITDEMVERAARAVHEVTGGGIPFGKPRRGKKPSTTVNAQAVALKALTAALEDPGCHER